MCYFFYSKEKIPIYYDNILDVTYKKKSKFKICLPVAKKDLNPEDFRLINNINLKNYKLDQTLDLDAFFGLTSMHNFKQTFLGDLIIDIDNISYSTYDPKIQIKHLFKVNNSVLDIKKEVHIKIGTINTLFGLLDLYIVLFNTSEDNTWFKKKLFEMFSNLILESTIHLASKQFIELISNRINSNKRLTGKLVNVDAIKILELIIEDITNLEPMLYFETFGNKTSTICTSLDFNNIYKRIESTFTHEIKNIAIVDLCISTSLGNHKITLANDRFFKDLKLEPNYILLFSETVKNLYLKTITSNGEFNKIGEKFNCYKINFYSTFKYHLDIEKTEMYQMTLSIACLLTNFYGHTVYSQKQKFDNLENSFKSICTKALNDKNATCPYRTELRLNLNEAESSLRILLNYLKLENFSYYESNIFFKIMQKNINSFLKCINFNKIENINNKIIAKAILSEVVLKQLYLTGMNQSNMLPEDINILISDQFKYFNKGIGTIVNLDNKIEIILNSLDLRIITKLIKNQIVFAPRLSSIKKDLIIKVILYSVFEHEYDFNNLFDIFVQEITQDITKNIDVLKVPMQSVELDTENKKVHLTKLLKLIFIKNEKKCKSSLVQVLFSNYIKQYDFSEEIGISNLITFIRNNAIKVLLKKSRSKEIKAVEFTFEPTDKKDINRIKKELLVNFNNNINFENTSRRVDDDEIIRYIHALVKYNNSNNKINDILFDFSYGFYPVRNYNWIKNRVHYLSKVMKTKEIFNTTITEVKNWLPTTFSLADRKTYFSINNIELSDEKIEIYNNLLEIDTNEWMKDEFMNQIKNINNYEIFKLAVQNSFSYINKLQILDNWNASDNLQHENILLIEKEVCRISTDSNVDNNTIIIRENIHDIKMLAAPNNENIQNDDFEIDYYNEVEMTNDSYYNNSEIETVNICNEIAKNQLVEVNMCLTTPLSLENIVNDAECLQVNINESITDDISNYYSKRIFNHLKFKKFTINKFRILFFHSTKRPNTITCKNIINALVDRNILSKLDFNFYKFNLKTKTNKFLSYDYIINKLSKECELNNNQFKISGLFKKITNYLRPDIKDWNMYFEDLCLENIIKFEYCRHGGNRYSFNK